MKNLLLINSSARVTRSITRRLTERFAQGWKARNPEGAVVSRDVGLHSPPPVNEAWIAAAFCASEERSPERREALAMSEELIAELEATDLIVIGVPMYNFGMPAALKAWVDQVVRIGQTFDFDPAREEPYGGLLANKPVVVLTSAGDGAVHPGGALAHWNFLEPHLATALGFMGLADVEFVRVGYDEYQDDRLKRSLSKAEAAVDEVVGRQRMKEGRQKANAVQ